MQPDTHTTKYASFLDGLTAYLQRKPARPKKRKGRELDAILAWRNQPTGEPVASNWNTAANDNRAVGVDVDQEEAAYATEMVREISPSVGQIMKQVKGTEIDIERNKAGQIIRIGKLRFSDGTQTEKVMMRTDSGVFEKRVRVPAGAMLNTRERLRKEKGGTQVWGAANKVWIKMLDGKPQAAQGIASGPVRRGKSCGKTQSRAALAQAYTNTPVLPAVTKCPPGLPYKPERIADAFLAGKKSRCAGGGSTSWQESASALASVAEWQKARAEMLKSDMAVLDAAMTAQNYGDIGAVVGKGRKAGPRLLRAANDNAAAVIKKYAA